MSPIALALIIFAAAFALTAAAVPLVRRLARGGGLYEQPVDDRWHTRPVPKLGGVAMAATFAIAIWPTAGTPGLRLLLVAPLLMFVLGLVDDLRPMRPTVKFIAQFAVAGAFLTLAPATDLTGIPAIDVLLGALWFVGITNAFNLLDNIDGLAAGVAVIAGAFLAIAVLVDGNPALLALAGPVAAMAGVAAGFLAYNWHPASIFMGDGGSYLLGSFFAGVTLLAAPHLQDGSQSGVAIAVILLFVPCADTALVILTRHLSGRSAFVGGRDHLSHRFVALGMDDRRAVLALYAVAIAGGITALGLQVLAATWAWALVAVYAVGVAALGVYLGHVDVRSDTRSRKALPLPTELTTRYRGYEIALDALLIGLAYYLGLVTRFRRPEDFTIFLDHFRQILPLVAVLHLAGLWIAGEYRVVDDRSTGLSAVKTIVQGVALGSALSVITVLYLTRFEGYSRQVFATAAVFVLVLLWSEHLALKALDEVFRRRRDVGPMALVYGAGHRGALAIRELRSNETLALSPYGLIDDDPARRRDRVEGLRVLGTVDQLDDLLKHARGRVTTIVLTIPSLPDDRFERLCTICRNHNVEIQQLRFSLDEVDTDRRTRAAGVIRFPGGS